MAWLNGNKIAWTYTDSVGNSWRRAAAKAITDQVNGASDPLVGGTAAASSVQPFAKARLRPRGVYCTSSGRPKKLVTVYADDAPLLVAGTSINLNTGVDSFAYVSSTETIPERKIRSWSITQST